MKLTMGTDRGNAWEPAGEDQSRHRLKSTFLLWTDSLECHRKQFLLDPGKVHSLPMECDPLLSESQIYEFPVDFFIFISLVAQNKIRIILTVELST